MNSCTHSCKHQRMHTQLTRCLSGAPPHTHTHKSTHTHTHTKYSSPPAAPEHPAHTKADNSLVADHAMYGAAWPCQCLIHCVNEDLGANVIFADSMKAKYMCSSLAPDSVNAVVRVPLRDPSLYRTGSISSHFASCMCILSSVPF
jgi:hypothetical protein